MGKAKHSKAHAPSPSRNDLTSTKPTTSVSYRSQQLSYRSGPLPPPQDLAQYESVLPGAADRIFAMAESQLAHRHRLEMAVISSDIRKSYLGMGIAAGLTGLIMYGVFILLMGGHTIVGAAGFVLALGSLVGIFVFGHQTRKEERIRRAAIMTGAEARQPELPPRA